MKPKIDLEKFICSYVKWSSIQDALKDQGLMCWNGEIVEIPQESEDERIKKEILELVSISGNGNQFEEIKNWLEKQAPQEQDGFEAELNALMKKYEHLSKDELTDGLEFYLGVVRDDLDIVREDKPKWSDEDERGSDETIELLEYFINYAPEFRKPAIGRSIAWLKQIKQRMEEQQ